VSLDALVARAVALHGAGRYVEAEQTYRQVLTQEPRAIGVLTSLGNTLKAQRRFDEAVTAHLQALSLNQDFVEGWSNLGLTYQAAGKFDEAVTCIQQAVQRRPGEAGLQHNLGNALCQRGDFADAKAACLRALELQPRHVPAHITLATSLKELGHNEEALVVLEQAVALEPGNPDVHWNRGLALLLEGHWPLGWQEIEWRAQIPGLDSAFRARPVAPWPGMAEVVPRAEPAGPPAVTLVAEQGMGDAIQFVRYAPLVARGGAKVHVDAPAKLTRLLRSVGHIEPGPPAPVASVAAGERHREFIAPMFSLPRLCGPAPDGIVAPPRYLDADPLLVEAWGQRLGPRTRPRIGIAWQGNPQYRADRRRSLPLSHFVPLLRTPGIEFVSLQKGLGAEQLADLPPELRPRDLGVDLDNGPDAFVDTAAVLMHLDLVITSDTALPHLAAALGRDVWLLLPAVPDWRWGRKGVRTPWYPTMTLWRQRHPGDWSDVVARIVSALSQRVGNA
jgi:tetratricopeptide (TPR) repeat protein